MQERNLPDAIKHLETAAKQAKEGIDDALNAIHAISNDPEVVTAADDIVASFQHFEEAAEEFVEAAKDLL